MPPRPLKIPEVPAYVLAKHGCTVSKVTVYNWIKQGVKQESLEIKTRKLVKYPFLEMYTTDRWVDEFLQRTGKEVTA